MKVSLATRRIGLARHEESANGIQDALFAEWGACRDVISADARIRAGRRGDFIHGECGTITEIMVDCAR
jgi:hypothetical protein